MFRITPHVGEDELVLKLEGCLHGAWVQELAAYWREAAAAWPGRSVQVDLRNVCHVDAAGRELMALMHREGIRFVASGCVLPELVREIAASTDAGGRS